MMRDLDIRDALRSLLIARHRAEPDTLILDELGLCEGEVRIDLAVINGILAGYEIKSDRDTLQRLPVQADVYGRVLNEITLVVNGTHRERVTQMVPEWWGLVEAFDTDEGVELRVIREPRTNPIIDAVALAKLLWRDEVIEELRNRAINGNVLKEPRRVLWERLARAVSHEELLGIVTQRLKARGNWRAVRSPWSGDEPSLLSSKPYPRQSSPHAEPSG